MMGKVFFVTGTDTDVGKTYISCGILQAAKEKGYSTSAIKPIAAGGITTAEGIHNEDVLGLQKQCSPPLRYEQINAITFSEAIAPHIAANRQSVHISAKQLSRFSQDQLGAKTDITLIEGAGGWNVPLNDHELIADVAKDLKVPVILVVAIRLGCINHALLTEQAILADGLQVAGWISNQISLNMPAYKENMKYLKQGLRSPLLSEVQYEENFSDDSSCASQIDLTKILGY